ncbi:FAD/NAD(P)-binding domain-containing protein [Zalerion maritima]|uniref:Kynurenine 3-monooxygenase n=1 Tax=Zalerion maritima TaxID=339359 RepID=A0AAD5RS02_9PEZI|nr:FAD/NAD(P)-binding domain-containing protein [Zalerion maritima]
MSKPQKVVVVGAGPVGSLAALYSAQRGYEVHIYELRSDLRDPSTVPLNFTKSINLALSERGINAMRHSGSSKLLDHVFSTTLPMEGRMIHTKGSKGELEEEPQSYDIHGRTVFAVDRADLNGRMLDILEEAPNVTFHFNHKLLTADFKKCVAYFENRGPDQTDPGSTVNVDFDFMMGADGAHSAARNQLMRFVRMDYQQQYIDTLWCEFQIQAKEVKPDNSMGRFRISPNHLHIWPGGKFMFIAIPCSDGSFTCTLFLPAAEFALLELNPTGLPGFFDQNFPGVTELIPPDKLMDSFDTNPHLPLITIKCTPYHYSSSVVLLGDAAHAMVPFYGQGMNAGLEDVRMLFSIIDKYAEKDFENTDHDSVAHQRASALEEYSELRTPDAHAINDLALQNYEEMRAGVLSPTYRFRKWLEESLSAHFPSLGWHTKYSRVSFSNERYSEVVAKSERQGRILTRGVITTLFSPVLIAGMTVVWKYGRGGILNGAAKNLVGLFGIRRG